MLIDEFQTWRESGLSKYIPYTDEEDLFIIFCNQRNTGKDVQQVFFDILWQIYQLQICVEGILEEQDI